MALAGSKTTIDGGERIHRSIRLDESTVVAAIFARTWQRPPTRSELEAIVDEHVREEAAYRAGVEMGLDTDDTIIRRRIRQKLDFIAEDLAGRLEPTDHDLRSYLEANSERFAIDPRWSFRQVYLDPSKHGEALGDRAGALLATMRSDDAIDASRLGDRIMLEHAHEDLPTSAVAGLFGRTFAEALPSLAVGRWSGPVPSGFGVHLVFVDGRRDGRLRSLEEVRVAVRREWEHERRSAAVEAFFESLVDRYEVTVEWPVLVGGAEPGVLTR